MRNHWDLLGEGFFRNTGEDWLQNLLGPCNQDTRTRVLLLLWRCWFLRDDCTHNTGKESICRSSAFLLQYEEDLHKCEAGSVPDPKGKNALVQVGREAAHGPRVGTQGGSRRRLHMISGIPQRRALLNLTRMQDFWLLMGPLRSVQSLAIMGVWLSSLLPNEGGTAIL